MRFQFRRHRGASSFDVQVGGCSLRLGFARCIIGGVFFFVVDILGGREQIRTPEGTVVSSAILKVLGITVAAPPLVGCSVMFLCENWMGLLFTG